MIIMIMIDREEELNVLDEVCSSSSAESVLVYIEDLLVFYLWRDRNIL